MMYTVKAKSKFTGKAWGLNFIDGAAKTDDKVLAEKLGRRGYAVSEVKAKAPAHEPPKDDQKGKTENETTEPPKDTEKKDK